MKCFTQSIIDATYEAHSKLIDQFKVELDFINADKDAQQEIKDALTNIGKDIEDIGNYFETHKDHIDPSYVFKRISTVTQKLIDLTKSEKSNVEEEILDMTIDDSVKSITDDFNSALNSIKPLGEPSQAVKDKEAEIQSDIDDLAKYLKENPGHKNNEVAVEKIRTARQKIIDLISYETNFIKKNILGSTINSLLTKIINFRKSASALTTGVLQNIEDSVNTLKSKLEDDSTSFDVNAASKVVADVLQKFNKISGSQT